MRRGGRATPSNHLPHLPARARQAPVTSVRFVAVSATIPNIHDVAAWLGGPDAVVRAYGEELRPVKLTTSVKARGRGRCGPGLRTRGGRGEPAAGVAGGQQAANCTHPMHCACSHTPAGLLARQERLLV